MWNTTELGILEFRILKLIKECLSQIKLKLEYLFFFLLLQMNNYLYLKFLELLTPRSLPYKHHPRELPNNYPMNYLHVYWERCLNSPFPRYFKRKGDRKTMAPERGYGKYTSNMADDLWLQVHVHKDELRRWLKARSLKTTTENKNLSTVWLKRRKVEMRLEREKGSRN